jgi:hypothetical protein
MQGLSGMPTATPFELERLGTSRAQRQASASQWRKARLGAFLAAFAAAFVTVIVLSSPAGAVNTVYCTVNLNPGDHCDAPARHSLTANQAYNYYGTGGRVCAGATLNGSFYDDYVCNPNGFAEHCYSGSNLLVGRIHNGDAYVIPMQGKYFYSEQCP